MLVPTFPANLRTHSQSLPYCLELPKQSAEVLLSAKLAMQWASTEEPQVHSKSELLASSIRLHRLLRAKLQQCSQG